MFQTDLFDSARVQPSEGVAGLTYADDAIDIAGEERLIAAINGQPLSPFRFQGWSGKRLTYSFGWSYDFETYQAASAAPLPEWLLPIRRTAAKFIDVAEVDLVQALLIRYDPGAGIGWHRDRPIFEHVVGISLGADTTLRLRVRAGSRFKRHKLSLARRSIYALTGDARHLWEHSINPMEATRWSITFRSLSARGRSLLL